MAEQYIRVRSRIVIGASWYSRSLQGQVMTRTQFGFGRLQGEIQPLQQIWSIFSHSWLVGKIYMFFEVAVMGCNIILWYVLVVNPNRDWRPLSPVKPDTHTYTHSTQFLSPCPRIALSIICPWKSLLLHRHTSFRCLAFCHFTAAIHLPLAPPCSVRWAGSSLTHRYAVAFWKETVILGKLTNAPM